MTSPNNFEEPPLLDRSALGLAIVICGQPIAWGLRGTFGFGNSAIFPVAAVVLGALLMLRPEWIRNARLSANPILLATALCLLLAPMAILLTVDLNTLANDELYMLFLMFVAILVAMTPQSEFQSLPFSLMLVGLVGCTFPFLQIALFGLNDQIIRLAVGGNANPLALASVGGVTAISATIVGVRGNRNRSMIGALAAVAFVAGCLCVVLSVTRSAMIFLTLCLVAYVAILLPLARARPHSERKQLRGLGSFAGTLASAFLLIPTLLTAVMGSSQLELLSTTVVRLSTGAFNLFAESELSADSSSAVRLSIIKDNWNNLDWFGHGIMAQVRAEGPGRYPHLSYLQAYYDFGLLGGSAFFILVAVIPVAIILLRVKKGQLTNLETFLVLYYLFSQGEHLMHGVPDGWTTLMPVVLIYVLLVQSPDGRLYPRVPMQTASQVERN